MLISPDNLPVETLRNIVEEFVTRDGTDYGAYECSLEAKVDRALKHIHQGDVLIVFDESSETVNLVHKHDYVTNHGEA